MSEFWYTLYTLQDLYGKDYESFSLFGRVHLFWLAISVFVWILGAFVVMIPMSFSAVSRSRRA